MPKNKTKSGKAKKSKVSPMSRVESKRSTGAWSKDQGLSMAPIRGITGGFKLSKAWAMAGQEDVEYVRMRYETTSAFTASSGTASYVQIKGNSIYRPYASNTDSPAGYQRLYTQYGRSVVMGTRVYVQFWSDTSLSVQQPFRAVLLPCSSDAYTIYSAYSNIAYLRGVPHAAESLFSPGAKMPVLKAQGSSAQLTFGMEKESAIEVMNGTVYAGSSGSDPTSLWYFLLGYQAMAGTSSLNVQAQITIEYDVKFYRPVATAVQSLTINRDGNEECDEKELQRLRSLAAGTSKSSRSAGESKGSSMGLGAEQDFDCLDDGDELEKLRAWKSSIEAIDRQRVVSKVGGGAGAAGSKKGSQ